MDLYVMSWWVREDNDEDEVLLDGSAEEFGLSDVIAGGVYPAEEIRRCICAEFPAGGDEEDARYTVLKRVIIQTPDGDMIANIEY